MKTATLFTTVLLLIAITGCSENPVTHEDGEDEEVSVTFHISVEQMETLENITFTATVTDDHGDPVTDLEIVNMQYRHENQDGWEDLALTLSGVDYSGTMMFTSSGDFEFRVMGRHHGSESMEILHEVAEHLHVERAHQIIGGFRVEYESFPGEINEGDIATLKYWVMEDTNSRVPVGGLQAEIHCEEPDGMQESHTAVESEPGVYTATHTFQEGGEAHATLRLMGTGSTENQAEFHFSVTHAH